MKRQIAILMAASLFAIAAPVMAEEGHPQGASSHQDMDEKCTKECTMLLKNCSQEVDSLQDKIRKLQVEINEKGANTYTLEELKILNSKLKEANDVLKNLQGR